MSWGFGHIITYPDELTPGPLRAKSHALNSETSKAMPWENRMFGSKTQLVQFDMHARDISWLFLVGWCRAQDVVTRFAVFVYKSMFLPQKGLVVDLLRNAQPARSL